MHSIASSVIWSQWAMWISSIVLVTLSLMSWKTPSSLTFVCVRFIDLRHLHWLPSATSDLSVTSGQFPRFREVSLGQLSAIVLTHTSSTLTQRLSRICCKYLHDLTKFEIPMLLIWVRATAFELRSSLPRFLHADIFSSEKSVILSHSLNSSTRVFSPRNFKIKS